MSEENVIVDGAVSVVSYVPRDESDYGTLLCWGRNELGRQRRPCVFHVIPAGEGRSKLMDREGGVGGCANEQIMRGYGIFPTRNEKPT